MMKVGIKINKINNAMVFKKSIPNILQKYIEFINTERGKVKEVNEILGNMYKLLGNSIYGKTVCRDVEDAYVFTTEGEIREKYLDNDLLDIEKIGDGETDKYLVRFKLNQQKAEVLDKKINKSTKTKTNPISNNNW